MSYPTKQFIPEDNTSPSQSIESISSRPNKPKLYLAFAWVSNLFGVLSSSLSCLTRFGLDVKVDKEENWKEGSKENGKVGTKLDLKSNSVCWEGLYDGVERESRGGNCGHWDSGNGGLLQVESRCNGLGGGYNCIVKKGNKIINKEDLSEA